MSQTLIDMIHCCCSCCAQAYSILHTAADGKLPKITALLHVEAFHALCQHTDLVTKVKGGAAGLAVCPLLLCVMIYALS